VSRRVQAGEPAAWNENSRVWRFVHTVFQRLPTAVSVQYAVSLL
jgi:hypothetical protein